MPNLTESAKQEAKRHLACKHTAATTPARGALSAAALPKLSRLRDRLAGEVARLKKTLQQENVRPAGQAFGYDARKVLAELRRKVDELVNVKTAVALANAGAYEWLYALKEWRGLAAHVLDTRMGLIFVEPDYAPNFEAEFVAQITRREADEKLWYYNQYIGWLQEQLDEYKHTRRVELSARAPKGECGPQ